MAEAATALVEKNGKQAARLGTALRVTIVGPSLRQLFGGQEVEADLLVRYWRDDEAVTAGFVPNNPELPTWLRDVERVPYLRTLLRLPFYCAGLWPEIKDSEIVHVFSASHSSFLLAVLPAWLIARLLGKRVLINYHSRRAYEHLRDSAVARRVLGNADCIVVPSDYLVDVFRQFGLRAAAVANIVDHAQFPYRSRPRLTPRLLCTRNLEHYCGVDLVVRAFDLVKGRFPSAHLCLAGQGTEERAIRALVRELGLQGQDVEFAGAIARDRIGALYAQSDIFINASRTDNMPVSILEAFAAGLPVVTTAAGGIPCFVKHEATGLLSEVGDWQGLAKNVIRLLESQDLALTLAQNGQRESAEYQWKAVRGRWLEAYGSLVPSQPSAFSPRENP